MNRAPLTLVLRNIPGVRGLAPARHPEERSLAPFRRAQPLNNSP